MHITVISDHLLYALQNVFRMVPNRSPIPILKGIHFETCNDLVYITATDLEHGIRTRVPAKIEIPGQAVLPAREITELIRRLPNMTVSLFTNFENNTTIVNYAQSEVNLHGFPPDEYPLLPNIPNNNLIMIPQKHLRKVLRQVIYATSTQEHHHIFTGVLFEFNSNKLTLVATDTHRLAMCTTELNGEVAKLIKFVVPGKTLNKVMKLLVHDNDNVSIYITENQVFFLINETQIVTRILAGEFPDYNLIIPKNISTHVKINKNELLEAVDRALLLSDPTLQTVYLQLQNNNLTVFLNSDSGRIKENIEVTVTGDNVDVGFNGRYLMDAVKIIDTEKLNLYLTGPNTPAMVKAEDDDQYISILVPTLIYKE